MRAHTSPLLKIHPLRDFLMLSRLEMVMLAGILTGFVLHSLYLNVPAEDAYITFRFARHFASGYGLVWNPGEVPVEGYTNFLWLIISAGAIRADLNVVLVTQILGVLISLFAILVVYRFTQRILKIPSPYVLLPGLFLSASGPFATWAASSMETNLFALLVLLGCYEYASAIRSRSFRSLVAAQVVLVLAALTRPEGLMVFAVLAAFGLLFTLGAKRTLSLNKYLVAHLVFLIPFLVYFTWRYQYFGYLLPNTFYAKTGGGLFQVIRGAKYSLLFCTLFLLPLSPVAAALLWEQEWDWSRSRRIQAGSLITHLQQYAGIYVCILVSLVYTLYVSYVGGDYMAMFRFFVPILPLIYLVFGFFACRLFARISLRLNKRNLTRVMVLTALVLTIVQSTPLEQHLLEKPWFMHGNYQGVQHERWHVARNRVIGRFFRRYKQSKTESLALLGIGIIPFVTDMKIYSFHGIVDPEIAHSPIQPAEEDDPRIAGHEKVDIVSVILKKPTYIMVDTGDLYPEPQPFPDYPDEIDAFVRQNYELKAAWIEDKVNHESGYLMFLELKPSERE